MHPKRNKMRTSRASERMGVLEVRNEIETDQTYMYVHMANPEPKIENDEPQ